MEKGPDKIKKGMNSYMRYSGIGFQIAGAAAFGCFIGYELDKYLKTSQPYFTLAFAIIFLFAGMYLAFRDLLKNK
jgi:F0F1-type ATP synthase assembly protein I